MTRPRFTPSAAGWAMCRLSIPIQRRGEKIPLAPAQAQRFKERSAAERVNSRLKERYGGRWVRVRGAGKVGCHLAFGLLALTVSALFARLG